MAFQYVIVNSVGMSTHYHARSLIFTYKIKEVIPEGATQNDEGKYELDGVTYDDSVYEVTVTVTEEDDGSLTVKYGDKSTFEVPEFENTVIKGNLEVTKKVLAGTSAYNMKMAQTFYVGISKTANPTEIDAANVKPIEVASGSSTNSVTFEDLDLGTYYVYEVKAKEGDTSKYVPVGDKFSVYTVADGETATVTAGETASAEVTNKYNATGTAELSGQKSISGRALKAGDSATMKIEAATSGAPMPSPATVTVTADEETEGNSLAYSFNAIEYELADIPEGETSKTFEYKVTESTYSMDGVAAKDSKEYTVTVTISDKGDGTLNVVKSANATALDFTNEYSAKGTTHFTATKSFADWGKANSFTFKLAGVSAKDAEGHDLMDGTTKLAVPMPSSDTAVASKPDSGNTSKAVFGDITYTKEGIYTYTITEQVGSDEGVTYDVTPHTVVVTVEDKEHKGVLDVDVKYDNAASLTITNTYDSVTTNLETTKSFNDWGKAENFTFDLIRVTADAPMPSVTYATATKPATGTEAKATFGTMTFEKTGTYQYQIQERNDGVDGVSYDTTAYPVEVKISTKVVMIDKDGAETTDETKAVKKQNKLYVESIKYNDKTSLTITNTFTAVNKSLEATKSFNRWTDKTPAAGFTFNLAADKSYTKVAEETVEGTSPLPGNSTTGPVTGKATAGEPIVNFGEITFDKAGTYTYKIWEDVPDNAENASGVKYVNATREQKEAGGFQLDGITYDSKVHNAVVLVTKSNDAKNELTASVVYDAAVAANGTVTGGIGGLTITNTFDSEEVSLEVTKNFTGRVWGNADTFTFDLEAVNATIHGASQPNVSKADVPMPAGAANGKLTKVAKLTNDPLTTKKAIFGTVTYKTAGTYNYTITEHKGTADGVTYDTAPHAVQVVVAPNAAGKLIATATYTGTAADGSAVTGRSLTVTNTYKSTDANIKVTKEFNDWSKASSFTFTLAAGANTAKDSEGQNVTTPMPTTATSLAKQATEAAPEVDFGTIEYKWVGDYNYTITETDDHKDGVSYDTTPRNVVVHVTKDTNNALTATVEYPDKAKQLIITNTYASTQAPIEVTKSFNNWGKAESFTFDLAAVGGAPLQKDNDGDGVITATATKPAQGATSKASFGDIVFEKAGIYEYTVTERKGTAENVTYDTTPYKVIVVVTKADDKTNALSAKVYYKAEKSAEGVVSGDESLTVTNTYKTDFHVKKTDADDSTKELTGAVMTLYDADDNVVDSWISETGKDHDFGPKMEIGKTYTLKEDGAPAGYKFANEVKITINEDGTATFTGDSLKYDEENDVYRLEDEALEGPTFKKKIADINDSTDDPMTDITATTVKWQDSADYDIGDAVPYKLTATLADNVTDYRGYHITFHDVMEKGLTFKEIVKVTVNGKEVKKVTDGGKATDGYVLTTGKTADDEDTFDLTLTWGDLQATEKIADKTLNGADVEVFFTATLNNDAVLGKPGNVNKANLEYSNNANVDANGKQSNETETTEDDFVIAFTYKVDINKVDEDGAALPGAAFKLEKVVKDGAGTKLVPVATETPITDKTTTFTFKGLDDGDYVLTETKAPVGYAAIDPIRFTVTADHNVKWEKLADREKILTTLTGKVTTGELELTADAAKAALTGDVENKAIDFHVKKTDVGDGKELADAIITIYDENGQEVHKWTSDDSEEGHDFGPYLEAGKTYTLKEDGAPAGYKFANEVTVKVAKDGKVTFEGGTLKYDEEKDVYRLEDEATEVRFLKLEKGGPLDKGIAGAHLQILDPSGKVVAEWDTTEDAKVLTGVLSVNVNYTLHETKAPKGYTLAKDSVFKLSDAGNPITVSDNCVIVGSGNTVAVAAVDAKAPTFEKKIADINDTTDAPMTDITAKTVKWQDSADYDIGDAVPYRLTAVLAKDVTDYLQYHITFRDTMEKGLTFDKITKVTVAGEEVTNYELNKSANAFDLTLTWGDGEKAITDTKLNGATVEVFFTATLNKDAELGSKGNVNEAFMEYSCNPNVDKDGKQKEDTEETEKDFVIAFTYKVDINKIDAATKKALAGASFKLEKVVKDGEGTKLVPVATETPITDKTTTFSFKGLDDGDYVLTETAAPEGYRPIDPIKFTVTADHKIEWTDLAKRGDVLTTLSGDVTTGELTLEADKTTGLITGDVENTESGKPSFDKKIQDINDTKGESSRSQWQDSADYDIGDAVPYRLTATLADNVHDYHGYHITFKDEMEPSLTFDKITKVTVNGTEVKAVAEGGKPTDGYVLKAADDKHAFDLTLTWGDLEAEETLPTSLDNAKIEVYFNAILNENAILGSEGNVNTAKLVYSSDYNVDETGEQSDKTKETEEESVIAFTYKVEVNKVDEKGKPLTGAEFTLAKVLADGTTKEIVKETAGSSATKFSFKGLDDGDYILTETKAPAGYLKIAPVRFTVTANHKEVWAKDAARTTILTSLTGDDKTGVLELKADLAAGSLTDTTVENGKGSVHVSKTDVTDETTKEIGGAVIQIIEKIVEKDADGNEKTTEKVVEEWTSEEGKSHEVKGLDTGKEYTLRETTAPDGYTVTADTTFTIDETGKVTAEATTTTDKDGNTVILVQDEMTSVHVSKTDVTDETNKEIGGAHIQIIEKITEKDADGNETTKEVVVEEWDSEEGKSHEVKGLKTDVEYTLRETTAPEGYTLTADTTFTFDETGKVTAKDTKVVD